MARVSFSALIEEIVGKLAGSVFQDSYGGYQIRTRVSPRNPQTTFQQLRRGEFGYISALWRTLTPTERQSFIDNAATPPSALNLFITSNVNLSLLDLPTISTYTPTSTPPAMPVQIDTYYPGALYISASSTPSTVPAGYSLLIQATYEKSPTKIFTNPSQFSPIVSFDEGTDLSISTSITSDWIARYGQFRNNQRLCIKSCLIDKTNGNRTDADFVCANSLPLPEMDAIIFSLTQSGSSDPSITIIRNIPGYTLTPSRVAAGQYKVTSSTPFAQITNAPFSQLQGPGYQLTCFIDPGMGYLFIQTKDLATGTDTDGVLAATPFMITL